jgi:hypothetical protein
VKNLLPLIIALSIAFAATGQCKFPCDPDSRKVNYTQSYKLNPKAKTDDVYSLAQTWFNVPAKFTQKNADPPADSLKTKKNKNQLEVDRQFDNSRPLQLLNPEVNKMVGLGLLKYYGGTGTSIKLLYLKYDIYVEIKAGQAMVSVSNIRYFHFAPKNYTATGLYSFAGGKPCDNEGTIESLIDCENFHDEFNGLVVYFNKEVNNLFADFKTLLKQKKALYEVKTASASTASKTVVKKK